MLCGGGAISNPVELLDLRTVWTVYDNLPHSSIFRQGQPRNVAIPECVRRKD